MQAGVHCKLSGPTWAVFAVHHELWLLLHFGSVEKFGFRFSFADSQGLVLGSLFQLILDSEYMFSNPFYHDH